MEKDRSVGILAVLIIITTIIITGYSIYTLYSISEGLSPAVYTRDFIIFLGLILAGAWLWIYAVIIITPMVMIFFEGDI